MSKRMYVLVRRDLPWPQRAVQAAHAATKYAYLNCGDPQVKDWAENHETMILLGVEDQTELEWWETMLRERNIKTHAFVEPDMNCEKTAMAVCPGADSRLFRKLPLLN